MNGGIGEHFSTLSHKPKKKAGLARAHRKMHATMTMKMNASPLKRGNGSSTRGNENSIIRRMSMNPSVNNDDDQDNESVRDSDDGKSIRSKKSLAMTVASGVAKTIRKRLMSDKGSVKGSVKSNSKRDKHHTAKVEEMPLP